MTLAFQSLVMAVLLVCGAVAVLPLQLNGLEPSLSNPLRAGLRQPGLRVVESPRGQWFVNGSPRRQTELVELIQGQGKDRLIHYLPSDALPLQRVSRSLRWLRSLAPNAVVLEPPSPTFSPSP